MRFQQEIVIPARREAVWDLLADTERLNREMGLPPIHFEFQPRPGGGSEILATVHLGKLAFRYREHPFEWVRPEYYSIRRTFFGGPLLEVTGIVRLDAEGAQTRVTCIVEVLPRGAAAQWVAHAFGRKSLADFMGACRGFATYLAGKAATPYPRHAARPPAVHGRVQSALARLLEAGAESEAAERLAAYLEEAPPEDVIQIRPFALADRWALDRLTVLGTCLLAARVGMLDLRWRVLCPACRGARDTTARLSEVSQEVHCEACNLQFDAQFDRSVEVCFAAPPAIRKVREVTYCVGGPALTPHIIAQWVLAPSEERETHLELPPGAYALTGPGFSAPLPLQIADDDGLASCVTFRLEAGESGVQVFRCSSVPVATTDHRPPTTDEEHVRTQHSTLNAQGSSPEHLNTRTPEHLITAAVWRFENRLEETVLVRLEAPEWSSMIATAALVTSLQAFRDQFSSEVLAPGTELAIRQMCILFSDLKGSTAMYRRIGDAPSYRAVRDHFDFLRLHISEHEGAIVKTIGDAIMATFHDPADGLAAALAIQREAPLALDDLTVKLGLNWGPVIAVNANDALDYFGHTVNLAARIQRESVGGDVVLPETLAADDRVQQLLAGGAIRCEPFDAQVRGIEEPIRLVRVWPIGDSQHR